MRLLVILCIVSAAVHVSGEVKPKKDLCSDIKDIKCNQTEYKEYVKCLGNKRAKRQLCIDTLTPQLIQQQADNNKTVPCNTVSCKSNCIQSCTDLCSGFSCNDRCGTSCEEFDQPITSTRVVQEISENTTKVGDSINQGIVPAVNKSIQEVVQPIRVREIVQPISITEVVQGSFESVPPILYASNQTRPVRVINGKAERNDVDNNVNLIYQPYPGELVRQTPTVQNSTTIIQKETKEIRASSPNITTIIQLTNIVNNTNVVNVPTNINNTNVNNVDFGGNTSSAQQLTSNDKKCCVVVQPKVCSKIKGTNGSPGLRCVHRRHHTCGEQCAADTVHAIVRQPCEGPPDSCPPSIAYVPQPTPRCNYQPVWPYVACGNKPRSCDGCYDHYGYGFQQYFRANQPSCVGCYDDGFQSGSFYRQGPFYQPGYYHTPPMYNVQPASFCGNGCFGNDRMDPVFGAPSYSPYGTYPFILPQYFPPYIPQIPNMMPPPQPNPQMPNNMVPQINSGAVDELQDPFNNIPPENMQMDQNANGDIFQEQPSIPYGPPMSFMQSPYYPPSFYPPPFYPSPNYYPPPPMYLPPFSMFPGREYPPEEIIPLNNTVMSNSTNTFTGEIDNNAFGTFMGNATQYPGYPGQYPFPPPVPLMPMIPPMYPPPYPQPYPPYPMPYPYPYIPPQTYSPEHLQRPAIITDNTDDMIPILEDGNMK